MDNLTHVINFGLPDDTATYTHRSGRTGRAGKTGISVAIIHSREKGRIKDIEKRLGKQFERKEVPSPKAIITKQLFNLADRLEKVEVNDEEIEQYMPEIQKKLGWLNETDLLKRILSLESNRLLEYYKDAPVLDLPDNESRKKKQKRRKTKTAA